jgi:hypothetical protein
MQLIEKGKETRNSVDVVFSIGHIQSQNNIIAHINFTLNKALSIYYNINISFICFM